MNSSSSLPSADDYRSAIARPDLCFADAELRRGTARLNRLGLPLVWSGQFATVFQVETPGGRRAVRCFTGPVSDHQARYAALQRHVRKRPAPMLAEFDWLAQGIQVGDGWHPAVKMEWVEGRRLDAAVEEAVDEVDCGRLKGLAEAWAEAVRGLGQAGVTHGDLQHENVLVEESGSRPRVRLVDYDGVYLESLAGRGALEVGHPHYQHPARTVADFGPFLDHVPALVILLSLQALAVEPGLWRRYHADKFLIVREDDLRDARRSPLLLELAASSAPEVRRLTLQLVKACAQLPAQTSLPVEFGAVGKAKSDARSSAARAAAAAVLPASTEAPAPSTDWRTSWNSPGIGPTPAATGVHADAAPVAPFRGPWRAPAFAAKSWALGRQVAAQRAKQATAAVRERVAQAEEAAQDARRKVRQGARLMVRRLVYADLLPAVGPGSALIATLTCALLVAAAAGLLGAGGSGPASQSSAGWTGRFVGAMLVGILAPMLLVALRRPAAAAAGHALALLLLLGAAHTDWTPLVVAGVSTAAVMAPLWPVRSAAFAPRAPLLSTLAGLTVRALAAALLWREVGSAGLVAVDSGAALAAGLAAIGAGNGLRALIEWLQRA